MSEQEQTQEQQDSQGQTQQEQQGPGQGTELQAAGGQGIEGAERDIFECLEHPKKRRFLAHFVNTGGQVVKAARLARVSFQSHYNWLNDPEYKAAFEQAQEMALGVINSEIVRRGAKGYKEPVFYQGKVCGHVRKFSDNLLMFRAKRLDPLYRDNYGTQVGIMSSGQVQIMFAAPAAPDQAPQLAEAVVDADYQSPAEEQDQDPAGNGGG